VTAVDSDEASGLDVSRLTRVASAWREAGIAAGVLALATLIALALRGYLAPTNLAMVYLLGVVAIALRCGRRISIAASIASVAAFDFFCVPPYLTFVVSDYGYLVTFAGMLVVALVVSTQTARIRANAHQAVDRQARAQALYQLSRTLAEQTRVFDTARAAATLAGRIFEAEVVIFLPEDGKISFRKRTSDYLRVPTTEEDVAQWAFDHGVNAGHGTAQFAEATALYVPLRGARENQGVMCVPPGAGKRVQTPEQETLLDLFANQTGLALDRTITQKAAEDTRLRMETEQMRSSLLSAVSHDLRTPLASITGAASTLRSQGDKLPPEVRYELLDSISEEAERLTRLVSNLLDMTRFESGAVELTRDFCPLEEIVGSALQRVEWKMAGRPVTTLIPEDLPPVFVDDVLVGQVVTNLLENALKYTPEGTAIELHAQSQASEVILEVRDRGPGFEPGEEGRIFEKFYRGASKKTSGGAGLGLAICRAVLQAHQGSIQAFNRPGGGAVFQVRLPTRAA
jgi:two-component system sensor histidine kinase KdpD